MKTIKKIAKEFIASQDLAAHQVYKLNNSKNWKTYIQIDVSLGDDCIIFYFMEHKRNKSRDIEIVAGTKNIDKYVKILKGIEPDQKIKVSKKIITYTSELV